MGMIGLLRGDQKCFRTNSSIIMNNTNNIITTIEGTAAINKP